MIESSGRIYSVLREYQRDTHPTGRRSEVRSGSRDSNGSSGKTSSGDSPAGAGGGEEYATVINLDYVPSGKVYLNKEAQQHIIDFFQ